MLIVPEISFSFSVFFCNCENSINSGYQIVNAKESVPNKCNGNIEFDQLNQLRGIYRNQENAFMLPLPV